MNTQPVKATLKIQAEIGDALKSLEFLSEKMDSVWGKNAAPRSLLNSVEQLRERLGSLKSFSEKGLLNRDEIAAATRDYKTIKKEIHDLQTSFKLLNEEQKKGLLSTEAKAAWDARVKAIEKYTKATEKAAAAEAERQEIESKIKSKKRQISSQKGVITKASKLSENAQKTQEYRALEKRKGEIESSIDSLRLKGKSDTGVEISRLLKMLEEVDQKMNDLGLDETRLQQGTEEIEKMTSAVHNAEEAKAALQKELKELENSLKGLDSNGTSKAFADLKAQLVKLGVTGADTAEDFDTLYAAVKQMDEEALQGVNADIEAMANYLKQLEEQNEKTGRAIDRSNDSIKQQDEAIASAKAFRGRIEQLIGLSGAAIMMRKALSNAIETIRNLDAAMTEMAVVTDLDIGEYWEQLPEYTKRANALGLAIQDVYEADTLFYQQGLKTNEVVQISTETMKMARIAGLETADATDRMTAALRGFNMELNQTNAQNIADVYSKLAAITASDVDEISAAMTKTASIASSAGMEFETTAAFLSQIIETTRESAETAGTAMKTVIARFQELKKDPSEIGEVDGEIVDANKIETALRSVGVSLRDASGQFRELDDVFLELSSKWDSLDKNTQRYIATIAAGSRQQSRFIAMMQDYERTQELVTAANNSAGASNEQYTKTLDSIETKITKLENAWNEFSTGLLNSDLVKFAVDFLTSLLTTLNKITEGFGRFTNSLTKITTLVAVFQIAKVVIKKFFDEVVQDVYLSAKKAGENIGEGVKDGLNKNSNEQDRILAYTKIKAGASQMKKSGSELNQLRKERKQLNDEKLSLEIFDGSKEEIEDLKKKIADLDTKIKTSTDKWKQGVNDFCSGVTEAAQAITMLGVGIGLVGQLFQEAGFEEVGNAFQEIGKWVTMFGSGMMAIVPIVKLLGTTFTIEGGKIVTAGTASQVAWWWVFLIVAAIAALAFGVVMLGKAVKKLSAEKKFESMKESADAAAEAADKMTESYNNLRDSLEGINDMQTDLEGMVKGTDAWKKSVEKLNEEVLTLIQEYPTLAQFVKNQDGILTIDINSAEVQAELERAKQLAAAAQITATGSNIAVLTASNRIGYENLDNNAKVGGYLDPETQAALAYGAAMAGSTGTGAGLGAIGFASTNPLVGAATTIAGGIAGLLVGVFSGANDAAAEAAAEAARSHNAKSETQTEQLAKAIAKGDIVVGANGYQLREGLEESRFEELYSALDTENLSAFYAEVGNSTQSLREFGQSLIETENQALGYYSSMATQIYNNLNKSGWGSIEKAIGQEIIDEDMMLAISNKIEGELSEVDMLDKNLSADMKNRRDKAIEKAYGEGSHLKENEDGSYSIVGLNGEIKMAGVTSDILKSIVTYTETKTETEQSAQLLKPAIQTILDKVGQGDEEKERALIAALSDTTGETLTKSQKDFLNTLQTKDLQDIYQGSTILQQLFGSEDNFLKKFFDPRSYASESFEMTDKFFTGKNLNVSDLTSGALVGLAGSNHLEQLYNVGTAEEIAAFETAFNSIMDKDNAQEIAEYMNSISDWSDLNALLKMEYVLQEQFGLTAEQAHALTTSMINATDATAEFNTTIETFGDFYQAVQKLNQALEKASNLVWEYENVLKNSGSASDMTKNFEERISSAMETAYTAIDSADVARRDTSLKYAEGVTKVAGYDLTHYFQRDEETGEFDIETWQNFVRTLEGNDKKLAEEWANEVLEQDKKADEQLNIAKEQYTVILEIKEMQEEAYWSIYDMLGDVITSEIEKEIATQQDILDATETANEKMLDKMQKQINATRQAKENEDKEKSIADLYSQQAYLQMATGGTPEGSDLQSQIDQAQEEYQNSLIDQQIQAIEDANEEASQQRERQIAIAEQQLDAYKNSATYYRDVYTLVDDFLGAYEQAERDNVSFRNTEMGKRIQKALLGSMTPADVEDFWKSIDQDVGAVNINTADVESSAMEKLLDAIEKNTSIDALTFQSAYDKASAAGNADKDFKTDTMFDISGNADYDSYVTKDKNGKVTGYKIQDINEYTEKVNAVTAGSNKQTLIDKNDEGTTQYTNAPEKAKVGENKMLSAKEFYGAINNPNGKVSVGNIEFTNKHLEDYIIGGFKDSEQDYSYQGYVEAYRANNPEIWAKARQEVVDKMAENIDELEKGQGSKGMQTIMDSSAYTTYSKQYVELYGDIQEFNRQVADLVDSGRADGVDGYLKGVLEDGYEIWIDGTKYSGDSFGEDPSLTMQQRLQKLSTTGDFGAGEVVMMDGNLYMKRILMKATQVGSGSEAVYVPQFYAWFYKINNDSAVKAYKEKLRAFKTGGLADFTGPAWLDGTKARPELVLNQTDTQNFIALKDILADIMDKNIGSKTSKTSGDNYFDIEINVEKLENDYDVEQVADKIRSMIYQDATYRNVNSINNKR